MNPDNTAHRLRYAFALMVAGDNQAALQQAEVLAAFDSTDHAFHFNLGQVFWVAGDSKRGRAHLELALLYARDGDERRDVYEQLADFEG